jgi:hypothetical protein
LQLARTALQTAGVSASIIEDAAAPGVAEVVGQAQRMLTASALARALAVAPQVLLNALELRRAFAALIALEQDPAVLRPFARARILVSALSDAMHPATLRAPVMSPPPLLDEAREPPAYLNDDAPTAGLRGKAREPPAYLNDDAPVAVTHRALTRCGGLLFLLHSVEELNLPEEILVHCARRPFRWVLHQLALALVPVEPDDPAALAFAGLLPDAVPPSHDEEPPTEAEGAFIATLVERIQAMLEERLEERPVIAFVCQRAAEIVADPGWIEVRLSLNDVSTAIRRMGLDLDPGYVPWLGVVVRFVYE